MIGKFHISTYFDCSRVDITFTDKEWELIAEGVPLQDEMM
jgi:hypothetical protein